MRKDLSKLAIQYNVYHQINVYPNYGLGGIADLTAGNGFRVAQSSVSDWLERTYKRGIQATVNLCIDYRFLY
jgi:hypothetical protein